MPLESERGDPTTKSSYPSLLKSAFRTAALAALAVQVVRASATALRAWENL
jgi:phage baseplate assembly protein W